jgi:hypothetical protein
VWKGTLTPPNLGSSTETPNYPANINILEAFIGVYYI